MTIVQIGILGIAASVLAIQLQDTKKEYVIVIGLVTTMIIFFNIITSLEVIINAIYTIQESINVDVAYIEVILKMLGITYVSELTASICKDAGYGSIGKQIELFAKVTILAFSMPVLLALLQTFGSFLN